MIRYDQYGGGRKIDPDARESFGPILRLDIALRHDTEVRIVFSQYGPFGDSFEILTCLAILSSSCLHESNQPTLVAWDGHRASESDDRDECTLGDKFAVSFVDHGNIGAVKADVLGEFCAPHGDQLAERESALERLPDVFHEQPVELGLNRPFRVGRFED